jgi:Rrf2 family nitric oxide-sensitive transcriptional repressor
MNFTKTTSYSLNVLAFLAKNENHLMSASYLHKQLDIPYSYLRSVLLDLARKGLITGTKGRNGGFRLARAKYEIFLSEIIDATEGLDNLNNCFLGFEKCPFNNRCFFHPLWVRMRSEIKDMLTKKTLADLLTDIDRSLK